jgi:hypothetical protein
MYWGWCLMEGIGFRGRKGNRDEGRGRRGKGIGTRHEG